MPIKSMTGFANSTGSFQGLTWRWEIRSVNGRGLDLRFRLSRRDRLEPLLRERIAQRLNRGSLQVSLHIEQDETATTVEINHAVLEQVSVAAHVLAEKMGVNPPSADGLLALPGVMTETAHKISKEEIDAQDKKLLSSFEVALTELDHTRKNEGAQIEALLRGHIDDIKKRVAEARGNPARKAEAIAEKISAQLSLLLQDHSSGLSSDRLYTEAALLAVKADIAEEIDRIEAHTETALKLLDETGPVGRKFEFLSQEFAREANTLCSKANDPGLTKTGLRLKTVIDQMREQSLNIE